MSLRCGSGIGQVPQAQTERPGCRQIAVTAGATSRRRVNFAQLGVPWESRRECECECALHFWGPASRPDQSGLASLQSKLASGGLWWCPWSWLRASGHRCCCCTGGPALFTFIIPHGGVAWSKHQDVSNGACDYESETPRLRRRRL